MRSLLKSGAKAVLRSAPSVFAPLWRRVYPLFRRDERWAGSEYAGDRSDTFTTIYRENRWGDAESVSGSGSTLANTRMVQSALDKAFRATAARSLLDAPCGDFNWMAGIRLPPGTAYIGGEIVSELVDKLQLDHGSASRRFVSLDIVSDPLPKADLWLCRHVLMHLAHADILKVLANFASSGVGYILVDNYDFVADNRDITTGGYRHVNLRRPPFNLSKPIATYPNSVPPEAPDYLSLWSREQVAAALARGGPR